LRASLIGAATRYCFFFVLSTLLPITPPMIAPAAPPTTAPFTLSLLVVAPMTAPAAAPIAASRAPCLTVVVVVVVVGALALDPLELDPPERRVDVGAVVVFLVVVVVVVIPGAGVAAARSAAEIESRVAAFCVASDKLSAAVLSALLHANAPRIAVAARRFVSLIFLRPEKVGLRG
jgi:hypothetical protein